MCGRRFIRKTKGATVCLNVRNVFSILFPLIFSVLPLYVKIEIFYCEIKDKGIRACALHLWVSL